MKQKQNYFIAALIVLLGLFAGQAVHAQKVGTSSLQFLKVMPTARGTAMGEAFVAVVTGVDGVFWNPAVLSGISSHDFTTTYTQWLFESKQYAIGYGFSIGSWGQIGMQFQMTDNGSIKETRLDHLGYPEYQSPTNPGPFSDGFTGRTFSPYSLALGITYAKQLTDHFSMGLTTKYVMESLWDGGTFIENDIYGNPQTYNSITRVLLFDFGMLYNTGFRTLRIGTAVQNFGEQVRFAEEGYSAPLIFRIGLAGEVIGKSALFLESENNRLTLAFDIIQPNDYDQQIHVGSEFMFLNMFAVRAGYKWNYDADGLTFGGGVNFDLGTKEVTVDYSFGSMGEYLPNVHRISMGVKLQ